MPDGPVNEERYAIGGCCVSDDDPTLKCIECGWKGDSEIDSYAKQIWQKLAKPKKRSDNGNSKR